MEYTQERCRSITFHWKTAKETVDTQKDTIKELKADLEEFKDADVSGMKEKITKLETDLHNKETEHAQQIADRDFQDMLKEAISSAKGKNANARRIVLLYYIYKR